MRQAAGKLSTSRTPSAWAAQQPGDEVREAKRPRFSPPPAMHMGFTSGSVDGVVGRLAEPQNLSRAAAFLSEAQVF